jgi:DNA polymerase III delta subunit
MPRFVVIARDPLIAEEGARARYPAGVPVERHYASDLTMAMVFNHLSTADLFSSQQAIHYVDFLDLKLDKAEGARLAELLAHVPDELTLVCSQVFSSEGGTADERLFRRDEYKQFADGAQLDDLRGVAEGEQAVRWLISRARERYGLAIVPDQAQRILWAAGGQPAMVDGELQKLSTFKRESRLEPVSDRLLEAALSLSPVTRLHEVVEAVLAGDRRAVEMLSHWFADEPETHKLLAQLRARLLALWRMSRDEKAPAYLARQLRPALRLWPQSRLDRAVVLLAETEYMLKCGGAVGESSQDSELAALELLISDLLEQPSARRA